MCGTTSRAQGNEGRQVPAVPALRPRDVAQRPVRRRDHRLDPRRRLTIGHLQRLLFSERLGPPTEHLAVVLARQQRLEPSERGLLPVSYTHLTLPTKRIV